jgi:hypothetical protein
MAAGEAPAARSGRLISAVAWAVLLLALWLWARELSGPVPGQPEPGARPPAGGSAAEAPPAPAEPLAGGSAPALVEIDSIGVRAEVMARGVDASGGVEPPPYDRPGTVGWYADGPTPGAEGAAVLVGHVDTATGPAVFYALSTVRPGTSVRVTREDGSVAEFTVQEVDVVERDGFDAERVYGPRLDGAAELRLITCGGTFDPARESYSANVVVSAHRTA